MEISYFSDFVNKHGIEIPNFQRSLNKNRVDEIYGSMLKIFEKDDEPFIPSPIIFCKMSSEIYLVDGNHRFNAYKKLLKNDNYDVKTYISVINVDTIEEIEMIFNQLNNSVPVEKLPKCVKMNQITPIKTFFMDKYPFYFGVV
jgi:hypothetical protein